MRKEKERKKKGRKMETKKGKKRKGEEIINKLFEKKTALWVWTKGGTRKKKEQTRGCQINNNAPTTKSFENEF